MIPDQPVYSLFSGGKDSFATAKTLQLEGKLLGVVLLDTGIAVPDWEENVTALAHFHGFPVEIYRTPVRYEWLVWKYGFPGPAGHMFAMNYLKGRAVREFKKAHPGKALASGVRKYESDRRAINAKEVGLFEGVTIYAPIYDWTTAQTWAFCRQHGYERPESYIKLGVSGDCLCGAYARSHERDALKQFYPTVYERICNLEAASTHHPTRCRWGWAGKGPETKTTEEAVICVECSQSRIDGDVSLARAVEMVDRTKK